MKRSFTILSFFILFSGIISCTDYSDDDNMYSGTSNPVVETFTADLTPVGGTESMASGEAVLKFNHTTNEFEVTLTFSDIIATHGTIHKSDRAIIFDLASMSPLTSPTQYAGIALNPDQVTELMNDEYTLTLHSALFPDGEISGTFIKTAGYE